MPPIPLHLAIGRRCPLLLHARTAHIPPVNACLSWAILTQELAFIIGHELSHVIHAHGTRKADQMAELAFMQLIILGLSKLLLHPSPILLCLTTPSSLCEFLCGYSCATPLA